MTAVTSILAESSETARVSLTPSVLIILVNLARRFGPAFAPFAPLVNAALAANGVVCPEYTEIVESDFRPRGVRLESPQTSVRDYAEEMKNKTQNFVPNYTTLKENWATQRVSTAQDWDGWLQRISSTMLQESPSASLRACATLQHYNLGGSDTELFHSGFMSVPLDIPILQQQEAGCIVPRCILIDSSIYRFTGRLLKPGSCLHPDQDSTQPNLKFR